MPRLSGCAKHDPLIFEGRDLDSKVARIISMQREGAGRLNGSITPAPVSYPPIYHYLPALRASKDDSGVT